jgi:octaprenyl-diphosphate synthase
LMPFIRPVQSDLDEFDRQLANYLQGDSPLVMSIARHLLKTKGKRMRPTFLFLTSRASGNFTEYSVEASLAIELIHTATLLHDDVVDESDLRRGQETVNAKWTNLISVLMGDYLFAKAFRIMVDTGSIGLIDAIARATERVSVGELRQIEEIGNYSLSEDEYLDIIANKTASLFNVCCETGPILNGRSTADRVRFAEFGEKIGTAFQIADDLLDFVGDVETTGKEPGNDVLNGKVTLPLIYSLKKVSEASSKEIVQKLKKRSDHETFRQVYKFISETGGLEYAYKKAETLCQEGLDSIQPIDQNEYYQSLIELVRFTAARVA